MSSAEGKTKIFVCGGVGGRIIPFVRYMEKMWVKNGMFDYVFCVGDFFGDGESSEKEWEQFKKSGAKVTVPIYTLGPNKKEHEKYFKDLENQQLYPNIFYLGKDGVFTTSDGLKIGYISGIQKDDHKENEMHTFNYESVSQFKESCIRSGTLSLDVLFTSPWPKDIRNNEQIEQDKISIASINKVTESSLVSWIAANLTPRYHITGMQEVYYHRSPYKNFNSNIITRFVGVGNYRHPNKEKWMYGFCIVPIGSPLDSDLINYNVTESPYASDISQYVADLLPVSKQYFYNTNTDDNHSNDEPPKKRKCIQQEVEQSIEAIPPKSCWFCLSNKNITRHMIISIGKHVYLTGARGLFITGHILIIPIKHYKSFAELPPEVEDEINLIKRSLNNLFGNSGRFGLFFERNILSAHYQLQVIPIPSRMIDRLEPMFKSKFREYYLTLVEVPPSTTLRQISDKAKHYIYIELPNGIRFFHNADKTPNFELFPHHITREVLAEPSLFNIPNRADWRNCLQSQEEEETHALLFRLAFVRYNPYRNKKD